MTDSLKVTDEASAAVAVAPRVSLVDIEAAIDAEYNINASAAVTALGVPAVPSLALLSICLIVLKNGFTIIGKSAPASPENFNAELGRKFAREDAVRQIWPLMGFALRDRLSRENPNA